MSPEGEDEEMTTHTHEQVLTDKDEALRNGYYSKIEAPYGP